MSISIYLILLIVLLVFNLVFWILIIWFRILFDCDFGRCCATGNTDDSDTTARGHRNLGFVENEDLYNSRPSTISQQMESPPSYEEALKYDQFGFYIAPPVHHIPSPSASREPSSTVSSSPSSSTAASSSLRSDPHGLPNERILQFSHSPPRHTEVRSRSSTTGSNSPLTPIREEDVDETPVTVVIDCIGVQASRLMENCDNKINISGGEDLNGQSKC